MKHLALSAALLTAMVGSAMAQPIVNGSAVGDEAFYGPALSTQTTRTGFGDGAGNPDPILTGLANGTDLGNLDAPNGGSELDQVFATVANGRLYVLLAGNLEANFNKFNVFIDSDGTAGGVNTLDGDNLPTGLDSFCCGGLNVADGALQRMNGLTFDAGFNADYALVFSNGRETVNGGQPDEAQFWAVNAHYADLTDTTNGAVFGLGMQLAPRGEPRVLRAPGGAAEGDYNENGTVDAADYTVWRDNLGTNNALPNDPTGGVIGQDQYDTWRANFGQTGGAGGALGDAPVLPGGNPGNTESLLSSFTLDGLAQGQLIDRNYALSGDGGCTDDTGANCAAPEFEFALNVDPNEANNESSHRNFDNSVVGLELALDNSNTAGIQGSGGPDFSPVEGEDDPENVVTGLEFSIPLDQIGSPTGDIRILAFVNNGNFDFFANQFSGDGIIMNQDIGESAGNVGNLLLGDTPGATLADFPGDQFVTVTQPLPAASVPEPSSLLLLAIAALAAFTRGRRA